MPHIGAEAAKSISFILWNKQKSVTIKAGKHEVVYNCWGSQ